MILCIDAGNSFVKYALCSRTRCVPLAKQRTRDALARRWPASLRSKRVRAVDGVMVSSVVPSLDNKLRSAVQRLTGKRPVFVTHRFAFPFKIQVERPRRLGIDRVCAAAGAVRHGAVSAIVIDVGSAITVDLVSAGQYRGGVIIAGPELTLRALSTFAEKLPAVDPRRLESKDGRRFDSTRRAMLTGARLGAAGAVREAVRFMERPLSRPASKTITGGGASLLRPGLPSSWRFEPDLVLRGLHHIWRLNGGRHD